MRDRDYYPMGAYDDPNAPYNQYEPKEIDVKVEVYSSLTKNTVITTNNYIVECSEDCPCETIVFSDLDEAYKQTDYTPLKLIAMLKDIAIAQKNGEHKDIPKGILDSVISSCDGWEEDFYVTQQKNYKYAK